jgi:hypothetical protein
MPKRRLALTLTAAAALGFPATSHALAGTADRQCYTHFVNSGQDPTTEQVTEPITVNVTGGTPGADFQVIATVPGKGSGSAGSIVGTFDAAGNGAAQLTNTYPPHTSIGPLKGQNINLSVHDFGSDAEVPIGTVKITNLALTASSKPNNPHKKRSVRTSGTGFAGQKVYGFVTTKNGKKVLRRFKVGTGNVCGYTKTKAVVAPSPFRYGTFRLYVNVGKHLARKRALHTVFSITKSLF